MATHRSVIAVIRAARPTFRNNHDKLTFAVHATFLASGHVLIATGPSADIAFSSPSTDEVGIDQWNELVDSYTFVYINPEKGSDKVLVKCLVMKNKLLVSAVADGASEPVYLEINVEDYAGESEGDNSGQYKNFASLFEVSIPRLFQNYTVPRNHPERGEGSRRNFNKPDFESFKPRGPRPFRPGILVPPINPDRGSDIFPNPSAGMYPKRGGFADNWSMLPGPDDPRWFGGTDGEPGVPVENPLVPPGARFDPYGPPRIPGFEPNRFVRHPGRPDGTHPDLQHRPNGSDFI